MEVGFVGLGDQGTPMAEQIVRAGFSLHVFARRPEVVDRFVALGAKPAPSLQALGAACEIVCVCVVDDAQVEDVLLGDNLMAGLRPGSVVVVHSTVHPETCRRLAAALADRGARLIDAPVSGGAVAARERTLMLIAGGEPEDYRRCLPVLEACGNPVLMGPLGSGQITKLVNNYFFAVQAATAFDEASIARQLGLDLEAVARVLPKSSSNAWVFNHYARSGFAHLVPPHQKGRLYSLGVFSKDIRLFRDVVAKAGVDVSAIDDTVTRTLGMLEAGGPGVIDESMTVAAYRQRVASAP